MERPLEAWINHISGQGSYHIVGTFSEIVAHIQSHQAQNRVNMIAPKLPTYSPDPSSLGPWP